MMQSFLLFQYLQQLWGLPALLFLAAIIQVAYSPSRSAVRGNPVLTLAVILSMFFALAALFSRFTVDDVYISLRYARNLADGHGLVFNTDGSKPVEGYTNFLWVVLEAPMFLMNLSTELILQAIRIIGIVFGAGVIVVTFLLTRFITGDNRTGYISALFMAAVPEFAFWAAGGLETSMYMFWMLLGIYRYLYETRNQKAHVWSMVFFFLMALTRPEGLFFAIAVVALDLFQIIAERKNSISITPAIRRTLIGAITFAVLYSIYFFWRYDYYGLFFPNSFYAKKISSVNFLIHRIRQVSGFMVPLFPFFAIACYGFFKMDKKTTREKHFIVSLMLLLIAFSFISRNEWMPGYRYELPFVPLLMVFFSAGISSILFKTTTLVKPQLLMPSLALVFMGMYLLYEFRELKETGDKFATQLEKAHIPLGKWLDKHAPDNSSYASWDMGAVPFFSGLPHIIDINSEGLLNPHTTLHGYDVDRFLSASPSFLVLPPDSSYVRPAEIRDFYLKEKVKMEYEFLFSVAFDSQYLLNVFRNKNVMLSDDAIREGKYIAEESRFDAE